MVRSACVIVFACIGSAMALAGPLHDAAKIGDAREVQAQIDAGADINAQDEFGETALIRAALEGQAAVVALLLDRKADIRARNRGGFTALHAAAYADAADIARMLLGAGASVNDRENKAGVSPLSIAAEQGNAAVARMLIDHGADVELAEQNGYTPLTRAVWRGQRDVIAVLRSAGARCQPVELLEEPAYSDCMAGQQ